MKEIDLMSACPNVCGKPLNGLAARLARDYLHKSYVRMEHVFSLTARLIDGMPVPFYEADDIADRKLLEQMGREVKGVRPPMLIQETLAMVEKLREFRFLFENALSFKISSDQYIHLLVALPKIRERFELEVKAFLRKIKETNNIND